MAEILDRPGPTPAAAAVPSEPVITPRRRREIEALAGVQGAIATESVVRGARGMSHFGEHALGWLAEPF